MASTIREAFQSFFLIYFILGISIYPVKHSKPRIRWIVYLNILYSLIIVCIYMYISYFAITWGKQMGITFSILHGIVITTNVLGTIIYTILNFYYQEKLMMCIVKLDAVDDTLEKLGSPKMYHKMCTWSKRIISGGLMYLFIITAYDTYWWLNYIQNIFLALIISFVLNHITHINIIVDLSFSFFLYVGNRFDKVNEHIQCLLVKKKAGIKCTWNKSAIVHQSTNNYKRVLWASMHLHLELRRIARDLNSIFEIQMVLKTASYFIYLTVFSYQLFLMIIQDYKKKTTLYTWLVICSWIFPLTINLYVINYIYDNVEYKAKKTCTIIHQLTTPIRYADMWKEIYQFALQEMHRPLKFTGLDLFQFGHKFIWKFCITITTYVMIMVQFKVPVDVIQG
ncbi:ObirGr17 [Ooceraea biroi]|uniref:Gustatory receptor n=1 Tax=Ooceraea biroi TaxID=2015173 RepID=A0A3L8DDI8_OOCBI|nr:ObirGr17 [Ooceraea biroi]